MLVHIHAGPADIVGIVEAVRKDQGPSMPRVGFVLATCTTADRKLVAGAMFTSAKFTETKYVGHSRRRDPWGQPGGALCGSGPDRIDRGRGVRPPGRRRPGRVAARTHAPDVEPP
jgi:hypothetical protein